MQKVQIKQFSQKLMHKFRNQSMFVKYFTVFFIIVFICFLILGLMLALFVTNYWSNQKAALLKENAKTVA